MRLTATVDINAPAEIVWACVEEPDKIVQWVEGAVGHRYITPVENGVIVGSQFEQKLQQGKEIVTFIGTVTDCQQPQRFGFHIPSPAYSSDALFQLTPLSDETTQVDYSIDVELHTLKAKVAGFVLRLPLTFFVPKQMRRLKQLAESLTAAPETSQAISPEQTNVGETV